MELYFSTRYPHMYTQVEILEKYIRANFKGKEEFASTIKYTRQYLNKIIKEAKEKNEGRLSLTFTRRLSDYGINIFHNGNGKDPPDGIKKKNDLRILDIN